MLIQNNIARMIGREREGERDIEREGERERMPPWAGLDLPVTDGDTKTRRFVKLNNKPFGVVIQAVVS